MTEYSSSVYSFEASIVAPVSELVSRTPPFVVRKTLFSSVTPPLGILIFVVLSPSVRLVESYMSHAPSTAATSVQPESVAEHEPLRKAYSKRNVVAFEDAEPSFDTSMRILRGVDFDKLSRGVSSTPPVAELAPLSLPSSRRKW